MTGTPFGLAAVLPFALCLLTIALLPVLARRWWLSLRRKAIVMTALSIPIALLLLRFDPQRLALTVHDYVSFIVFLGSLYVISGGILLTGDLRATPAVNAAFLVVGAVLSNLIGTTGASMLLIRPLLRTNDERTHTSHIPIFFIFLVSNIGGLLTPLGPPLFLGFIRGVPFAWTLRLWPQWLFAVAALTIVFLAIDTVMFRREPRHARILDLERVTPLHLTGGWNFLPLGGVVALVMFISSPWREGGMVLLSILSWFVTPRGVHSRNHFTTRPLEEIAILFLGIFLTMAPALAILEARGGALPLTKSWHFFWATGVLSSFLDNAPTYLTFSSVAMGIFHISGEGTRALIPLLQDPRGEMILRAISTGAVFMGANTYIGNGPNFMVKAICEDRGHRMPTFLGYMAWSMGILIPLFIAITLIFFRG